MLKTVLFKGDSAAIGCFVLNYDLGVTKIYDFQFHK